MGRDLTFSAKAREDILKGVNFVADAVKVTLGPQGRNVFIESAMGAVPPRITKDGVTVAKNVHSSDQTVNMGCQLVHTVAGKAVELAGDGTTTATILAQSMATEGNKVIVAGMRPLNVKKGIDKAVSAVVERLKSISREVSTNEEIVQVGTISANGDTEVGEKIAEAMREVGKEGVITIAESKTDNFYVDVVKGMRFDNGYVSPYFCTNPNKATAELNDVYILFLKQKVVTAMPLTEIANSIFQLGKSLLIIAEDFEPTALPHLIHAKIGGLKVCAVKAPSYGNFMHDYLEDMAILTNGSVYTPDLGIDLKNIEATFCGTAEKVIVTNEHTTIVNGNGDPEKVAARCDAIRGEIEEKKATHKVTILEERLARLTGGIAVLNVGGMTEAAMKERKDRVDDALHATKAAVEEGIVAGGGVALLYSTSVLNDLLKDSELHEEVRAGINIVKRALEVPVRQIVENAGGAPDVVVNQLFASDSNSYGYDAAKMEFNDMFDAGIVDPTKVVRTALQASADIAGLLLTAECLITEDKEAREEMIRNAMGNRR